MPNVLDDQLAPEVGLLSRWVAYQITRNGRGQGCPEPLFGESREWLKAHGVDVFWHSKRSRVVIKIGDESALAAAAPATGAASARDEDALHVSPSREANSLASGSDTVPRETDGASFQGSLPPSPAGVSRRSDTVQNGASE